MKPLDAAYCRNRADMELKMAAAATLPVVQAAHRELAATYLKHLERQAVFDAAARA